MNFEQQKEYLIRKRVFPLAADITSKTISNLENSLMEMVLEDSRKPITLAIDCCGGDVDKALNGYDFIRSMPCDINAAIIGACHSSTLTIMAACKWRAATTHARFMFHAMKSTLTIKVTEDFEKQIMFGVENLKTTYDQVMRVQQLAYNLSMEEIIEMRDNGERYNVMLTAIQAKEKGVIHDIVEKFDFLNDMELVHEAAQ